ncbi:MAG: hypothetical protein SNJ79_05345 [Sphingomonadaceae bacterium]
MAVSRRGMILGIGGAAALVAAGGVWRVMRRPAQALAPWDLDPEPLADVRLDAFRHAILAPNPHNRQPWLIRLDGADEATIFCDLDRRLPMTDPFDRQITIGFGCFLETARIAAAERGVALAINPFPEGSEGARLDQRPVAALRFAAMPDVPRDPLFAQIPHRRSNKEVYADRDVAPDMLASLAGAQESLRMEATAEPARVAAIRAQVLEALATETATPRTHKESIDLVRIGAREVDANPDGIDLTGPGIEVMAALGLLTREAMLDPTSQASRQAEQILMATYGSAPAYWWLVTDTNDRASQLAAGAAYVRANLKATELGLSMHPASQALQEYPEVGPNFERIHALLAPEGGRVQMLARVGHGPAIPPSPRFPLESKRV